MTDKLTTALEAAGLLAVAVGVGVHDLGAGIAVAGLLAVGVSVLGGRL